MSEDRTTTDVDRRIGRRVDGIRHRIARCAEVSLKVGVKLCDSRSG